MRTLVQRRDLKRADAAPSPELTGIGYGRLLQVRESFRRLGCSRSKLYGLMDSGELAYVRLGADRRISEHAIEDFIRRHTVGSKL